MKQLLKIVRNVTYEKTTTEEPKQTIMEPLFEIGLVVGEKQYTSSGQTIETETVRFYIDKDQLAELGANLIEMAESEDSIPII